MSERPPADQLRRIETRLNGILVLASALVALVFWAIVAGGFVPVEFVLLLGLPSVAVVLVAALALGSVLSPAAVNTSSDGADANGTAAEER